MSSVEAWGGGGGGGVRERQEGLSRQHATSISNTHTFSCYRCYIYKMHTITRDLLTPFNRAGLHHLPVADTGGGGGGVSGGRNPPSGPSMNIIIMPRVYEYHYCTPRVYLSAAMKRSTSILAYFPTSSKQARGEFSCCSLARL